MYLVIGGVLAVVCDWKLKETGPRERLTNVLLSLCTWPLFAPLALWPVLARKGPHESDASVRIRRAIDEARRAVAGTALATLLPESMLSSLFVTLGQVEQRRAELDALLARPDFQVEQRLGQLEAQHQGQHRDSVLRLRALLERDRATLQELVELAEALRAQLLVARYSGKATQASEGVLGDHRAPELAFELAARVESLGAWFELDSPREATDTRTCA
jgi:hypothetical protein